MKRNSSIDKKVKAAKARAKSLSAAERRRIARKAAMARWNSSLLATGYEGEFSIGDVLVSCAVLPNGQRIITQSTFLRALGRSPQPKAGKGVLSTLDELPYFLANPVFEPFITESLKVSTTPIFYQTKSGTKGVGYDARLLPKVAEIYLRYRDNVLTMKGRIPRTYQKMIVAADILIRGLADVGIIALVDEATGYQRDRARDALSKILEEFIAKELRPWIHTFPDQFYEQLFRLRGLSFPRMTIKRPQYFGHLTNDIVYSRLAPAVLDELKKLTPRDIKGRHKHQFHRRLTPDVGHPKLREHLASIITLMKISKTYSQFLKMLDTVHPKYNENLPLPLYDQTEFALEK